MRASTDRACVLTTAHASSQITHPPASESGGNYSPIPNSSRIATPNTTCKGSAPRRRARSLHRGRPRSSRPRCGRSDQRLLNRLPRSPGRPALCRFELRLLDRPLRLACRRWDHPLENRELRSARQNTGMDSQQLTAVQQATIARRAARERWIEAVYDAQAAGASLRQIAEVAGVSAGYLSRVLRGQRLAR
jgi:hypothetical protein